jgi:hypothetical protein
VFVLTPPPSKTLSPPPVIFLSDEEEKNSTEDDKTVRKVEFESQSKCELELVGGSRSLVN